MGGGAMKATGPPATPNVLDLDHELAGHAEHLQYRWDNYVNFRREIEQNEGGLAQFASAYQVNGLIPKPDGGATFREWMPWAQEAQLIGDFNGWDGNATPLTKGDFGVWECDLPPGTIEHGSRYKVRIKAPHGGWVDRLSAWTRYAVAEARMDATYDGIFWNPPANERHVWAHQRPAAPATFAPVIYEAHVGMATEESRVGTYREFADTVVPRIAAGGYNTVQLMAVMEHAYYASFGYHVTLPFGVCSRQGNPEDLKYLVDACHAHGLVVIMDVVHSHVSSNEVDGIAGMEMGQGDAASTYYHMGERGYHKLWDSKLYNYGTYEVRRYLLSNLRYWLEEFNFDGFRFDGVTSMLYHHHGIHRSFSGDFNEYFGTDTDVDACVYLMLANELIRSSIPATSTSLSIAEDVSGMPTLCRPVRDGGVGFDYRLAMALPDVFINLLENVPDEHWSMQNLVATLCNRRFAVEKTIAYVESHDQSIVGDKTVLMWLLGPEIYTGMSALGEPTAVVRRGMSLHMMMRLMTFFFGGEGYLTFMGNEFGHPEWVDFPREGNEWSHDMCRRQWSLADMDHLRYSHLQAFDRAMLKLEKIFHVLEAGNHFLVSMVDDERKLIVVERGPLVAVFNFHPSESIDELTVGVGRPGKYWPALDADDWKFGGEGRVAWFERFTIPEPYPMEVGDRPCTMVVNSPCRSAVVYFNVDDWPDCEFAPVIEEQKVHTVVELADSTDGAIGTVM